VRRDRPPGRQQHRSEPPLPGDHLRALVRPAGGGRPGPRRGPDGPGQPSPPHPPSLREGPRKEPGPLAHARRSLRAATQHLRRRRRDRPPRRAGAPPGPRRNAGGDNRTPLPPQGVSSSFKHFGISILLTAEGRHAVVRGGRRLTPPGNVGPEHARRRMELRALINLYITYY